MPEIIDLSQEIFVNMPVFPGFPDVEISMHASYQSPDSGTNDKQVVPKANRLVLSEHTGSHVDAFNHMGYPYHGKSIDTMPLTMFYTEGICLDLSHKDLLEIITPDDLQQALLDANLQIKPGDTVLLYTDHYRRAYGTEDWLKAPGVDATTARWLGQQRISAFGVESISPGLIDGDNIQVHLICGELGFTHYENLVNLYKLIGRGTISLYRSPSEDPWRHWFSRARNCCLRGLTQMNPVEGPR